MRNLLLLFVLTALDSLVRDNVTSGWMRLGRSLWFQPQLLGKFLPVILVYHVCMLAVTCRISSFLQEIVAKELTVRCAAGCGPFPKIETRRSSRLESLCGLLRRA